MRTPTLLLAALATPLVALADDDEKPAADPRPAGLAELNENERAFQEMLTGVRMTGSFTIVGRETKGPPKEESYEIQRLTKVSGESWLILARAKWGRNDVTLPFPVRVVWADDTPVITLTNVGFPGLGGKFSCRVLFREGRYAGTWKHDAAGGHMFGTFTKADDEKPEPNEDAKPAPPAE